MWKYYCFKIARFILGNLPYRIGYIIAYLVAGAVYLLSSTIRANVADNMCHVIGPDVEITKLKQLVQEVIRNTARNYVDFIRMAGMKLQSIEHCYTTSGWRNVEDALETGKGIVFVTAHLGSFDMAVQIFAINSIKVTIPVETIEPPPFLEYVTSLRTVHGLSYVPANSGVLKVLTQAIRRGGNILLVCDRDIGNNGLPTRFFGEETPMPTVAVRIAMRTGALILPVFSLRRGIEKHDLFFEKPIEMTAGGNGAAAENMGKVLPVLEKYISDCPEQWVVLNRFWANGQHG